MGCINICTLASSSSGNCTLVSEGSTHVLVDAGISLRRITAGLKRVGLTPRELSGVVVTHEHTDHIGGIRMLVKYHDTPILAPETVAAALQHIVPEARQNIIRFKAGTVFELENCPLKAFRRCTIRPKVSATASRTADRRSSLPPISAASRPRYRRGAGRRPCGHRSQSRHNDAQKRAYPYYLKRRILSDRGHLSNDDSGRFAVELARSGTRRIILAHLSRENNTRAWLTGRSDGRSINRARPSGATSSWKRRRPTIRASCTYFKVSLIGAKGCC